MPRCASPVPASLPGADLGALSRPALWPGNGDGDRVLRLCGGIDVREARPGFDPAARVATVGKEEGDRVGAGEAIGRLEDTVWRAQEAAAGARPAATVEPPGALTPRALRPPRRHARRRLP